MPFYHVLERLRFSPWFCTVGAYAAMTEIVDAVLERSKAGGNLEPKMEGMDLHDLQSRRPMTVDRNGVANIHVFGVLGRNLSPIENMCGRTDYATLEKEMEQAQSVAKAAFFDFDSPGGSAIGVDQTAKMVANMRIPTASAVETQCCSAAYYLAAGTNRIFGASGAIEGCIGTILPWVDKSKMYDMIGVVPSAFVNEGATLKGIGHGALTEEQSNHLQEMVDSLGSQFRSHIEDYRKVDSEVFKAGTYTSQKALDLGLIDEIGGRDAAMSFLLTKLGQ